MLLLLTMMMMMLMDSGLSSAAETFFSKKIQYNTVGRNLTHNLIDDPKLG